MDDVGKAFTYMFEDEDWITKIVVGVVFILLSFALVGIPFVLGYVVETIQNVLAGRPKPLPAWTNVGEKFAKGLVLAVALLIWTIPSLIISSLGTLAQGVGDGRSGLLVAVGLLFTCFTFIYSIGLGFMMPAIFIKFAEKPEFASAFKINDFVSMITNNVGNYVVVFLLAIVAQVIAAFGFIALCVGVLFTIFWSYLVIAHLYGQLGRSMGVQPPSPA
ncbi:MAG: DUF4013 domain-containing protein [Chloroflexi bacterium]|nr:DUF4013 domain-containing protein [Chloroflexota bacterium]